MIKVKFFAALRERLDCNETGVENFQGTAHELLDILKSRSTQWRATLEAQQVLCAVNQQLVPLSAEVNEGDEVALFPPVTGG
ncbi:MAG: MoaD/ThiS family protein [Idiomarina sp.]|nr:MoaD/ThiS family protein [Idiomarina sp.]